VGGQTYNTEFDQASIDGGTIIVDCSSNVLPDWMGMDGKAGPPPCPEGGCCGAAGGSGGPPGDGGGPPGDGGAGAGGGPPGDDGDTGMPRWGVVEPMLNLWLMDTPLLYRPAQGSPVALKLNHGQREKTMGYEPNIFGWGKNWNSAWLSYVTTKYNDTFKTVQLPGGGSVLFKQDNSTDAVGHLKFSGNTTSGYTLTYPDGSKNVYGLVVTNSSGQFLRAMMTERWNAVGQKSRLDYAGYSPANPVIRLLYVVDGDGMTNTVSYDTTNTYSTNLVNQVVDPFGRTAMFAYDEQGRMTNITDVIGLVSSMAYDVSGYVTTLITPYGTNRFLYTETTGVNRPPYGRSVRIIEPDGSCQLYLYTNGAPGVASSYASGAVPDTYPLGNNFDNSNLDQRNTFHWNRQQYASLSNTNIGSLSAADFKICTMKHWLLSDFLGGNSGISFALSLERAPSPDGSTEGQKVWYDYYGKTNTEYQGTETLPLFIGMVLPDGSTHFTRTLRNSLGAVTNAVDTYTSGATTALRTNIFVFDTNEIDLLRVTNALGVRVVSNAYNGYHQVATNFDALNQMTVYTYDSSHRPVTTSRPSGLVISNVFGGDGFISQRIAVGIATNAFTWSNDLMLTHTDPRGLTVSNTWDALNRLRRVDFPDGTFVANVYDKLDLVQSIDRMGYSDSYGYDSIRRLVAATNANQVVSRYGYCSCGSLTDITNAFGTPLEQVTQNIYDYQGNLLQTIYPDGYCVNNVYDSLGRRIRVSDAWDTTTNSYNNQGLRFAASNAVGRLESIVYDALDRATNTVDANGVTITNVFDNLNRPLVRGYPDGGVEKFGYTLNIAGLTSYTNQLDKVTRYVYDAAGRKTFETNANLELLQFAYSGANDLLTLTDGKNQTTTWIYDIFGRMSNKVDAASNEVFRYGYDANGRLTSRLTPAKGTTYFTNDPVGNVTCINYPNSPDITLQYDALNRLTNMVDALGTTKFGYTAAGLLASEDSPWSNDTLSYTYQNRLRSSLSLLQPNASTWSQTYGYDAAKRLTNITSQAGSFGYEYAGTRLSSVVALRLPGGTYITNAYDGNTRLLSTVLKNSTNGILNSHTYGNNVGNQRTALTNTPGDYRTYGYDDIGQLKTALGYESGGTSRLNEQLAYAYDAAGNLNFRTNNALVQTFNVNNLNELSTVTRDGTLTVAGTTTSTATNVTVNALTATRYTDNTFARDGFPLVDGTTNFTAIAGDSYGRWDTNTVTVDLGATHLFAYDLNGNLRTNGNRVLEYDDENQLTSVTVSNGWRSEFTYDGMLRRRVRKEYTWQSGAWLKTNEVHYVYEGNLVLQERDANNLPVVTYTRGKDLSGGLEGAGGIGGLLARTDNQSISFYHCDGNGNVTCLISTNQLIVAKYLYDPYGNVLSASGPLAEANIYRFSSKEAHPNSGLFYYLYRYHDPNLQRWLNRDPMGEEYDVNLYRFVYNSPLNYVDPDGLWGIQFGDFNIGYGNPNLAFDSDSWNDIGQGAQATLDGIIPFGDPFMNNGGYDPCDKTLAASRALGQFGRDIYGSTVALRGLARLGASRLPGTRWINSNRYLRFGNSGQPPAPTLRIGAARPPTPSNHIPLTLFGT
jgi:RHS repeat-associated protein